MWWSQKTVGSHGVPTSGQFYCKIQILFDNGPFHTAAILPREPKVALFYLSSLAPKFFTAESRVVKQSFFSLSGQYGHSVNKAHWVDWTAYIGHCNERRKLKLWLPLFLASFPLFLIETLDTNSPRSRSPYRIYIRLPRNIAKIQSKQDRRDKYSNQNLYHSN